MGSQKNEQRSLSRGRPRRCLVSRSYNPLDNLEEEAGKLARVLMDICNAAMPKRKPYPRKGSYWWTQEIGVTIGLH